MSQPTFTYDSDLTGGSLQVRESRIIASLLLDQANPARWKEKIQQQNLLQKRSPASARRVAQALHKRLERLVPPFWRALRDGDGELATQVVFCAALERNLLLVEFMETVVRDAFVTRAELLEPWRRNEFWTSAASATPPLPSGPTAAAARWARSPFACWPHSPMSSAMDTSSIPAELFTKFQTSFYADPVDTVFKALGGRLIPSALFTRSNNTWKHHTLPSGRDSTQR